MYNVRETVCKLNDRYCDNEFYFEYYEIGNNIEGIKFVYISDNNHVKMDIFNTENNTLRWIEEKNDYEDLFKFCLKQIEIIIYEIGTKIFT